MGQDICVKFSAQTASGKAVIVNVDRRAHRAVISSGVEYSDALVDLVCTLSKKGDEEWHTHYNSTRDFEPEHKGWCIIQKGDESPRRIAYRRPEGQHWHVQPETPEWYVEYPQPQIKYVRIYAGSNMDILSIGGIELDEELAQTIFNCLSDWGIDFVRYSDTHVISEEGIEAIETFSEKVQKEIFEVEPPFVNITHELFQWDAQKREFTMHSELKAIYDDVKSAVKGYDRGEFALWRTSEGVRFYQTWRRETRYSPKMETLKALGIKLIEGVAQKNSPFWYPAQAEFAKGALQYRTTLGNTLNVGGFVGSMEYKLELREDGMWHEVPFKLSDYYPIGFSLSYEMLSLAEQAPNAYKSYLNEVRSNWQFKVDTSRFYTARWVATYNGEVILAQVVKAEV